MNRSELELIQTVCRRPKFWVLNGTLEEVVAWIQGLATGIEKATGRDPLKGLHRWMSLRFGYPQNWAWHGVVHRECRRENPEDSLHVLSLLFEEWAGQAGD
jgi:hypothetical protein